MSDSGQLLSTFATSTVSFDQLPFRRVRPVLKREPLEGMKLAQALLAFDRAHTSGQRRDAQQLVLALGYEVVPNVLAELSTPQPPDRADLLLALLVKRESADAVIRVAISDGAPWILRAAMAEALARYATGAQGDSALRHRIASALATLARDSDLAVRSTAVDAIGLAGITDKLEIREILARIAEFDPESDVRAEARTILDESD